MRPIREVHVSPRSLEPFASLVGPARAEALGKRFGDAARSLADRTVWNVNSTARGGGVAEMLQFQIGYARGAGVDARWRVIEGPPAFFAFTKRLHNALHGRGEGGVIEPGDADLYEAVLGEAAADLLGEVRARDLVILHDPQTAGLTQALRGAGATVVWRCHVGTDAPNERSAAAWSFLASYLTQARVTVFTRKAYIPAEPPGESVAVIQPTIDPFSPKNQGLDAATVRAILGHTGLVDGPGDPHQLSFCRADGSAGRVDRRADVLRLGTAPDYETPLVVQVSRWDPLKDPVGVMEGFAALLTRRPEVSAHLILAGPDVKAVADDPEGDAVWHATADRWRALPDALRRRVHLASLPMADIEENAAIVNALQRHANLVVQKSLEEGFGLTVAEAMWKGRPVVASAVGGIQDQIEDGVSGLLLRDPSDRDAFARAVASLLEDGDLAARLGRNAHERVREHFLAPHGLEAYARLVERAAALEA